MDDLDPAVEDDQREDRLASLASLCEALTAKMLSNEDGSTLATDDSASDDGDDASRHEVIDQAEDGAARSTPDTDDADAVAQLASDAAPDDMGAEFAVEARNEDNAATDPQVLDRGDDGVKGPAPATDDDAAVQIAADATSDDSDASLAAERDAIPLASNLLLGAAAKPAVNEPRGKGEDAGVPADIPNADLPEIPAFLREAGGRMRPRLSQQPHTARLAGRRLISPLSALLLLVFAGSAVAGATYIKDFSFVADLVDRSPSPRLTVRDSRGAEDATISLDISVVPANGTELSGIVIEGVPQGGVLSAGRDEGDGRWSLAVESLPGLTLTPPTDYNGTLVLFVTAAALDGETAVESVESLNVVIDAIADIPRLRVHDVAGAEDRAIALNIAAETTDAKEALTVTVADVPEGASLSGGEVDGDGRWVLGAEDLAGLTLVPPADFKGSFGLQVAALAVDGDDEVVVSRTMDVTIRPVADRPELAVQAHEGREDDPLALVITATLVDSSERLLVRLTGLPEGSALSGGTDNGDGSWTLLPGELADLSLTMPPNYNGTMPLVVAATSVDGSDRSTSRAELLVEVAAVADVPELSVGGSVGPEDSAIGLSIAASAGAADEEITVVISDVPAGAVLSSGTDAGEGRWTVAAAALEDLTLTPPADFSGDIGLTVTATSADGTDQAERQGRLGVAVTPVADAPQLTVEDASGAEDGAIALPIAAAVTDGSEALTVEITDVPAGAVLSAGTDAGEGRWTVAAADLAGLTLTPPSDHSGPFALEVVATSRDGADTAQTRARLGVTVAPVADAPQLTVADASGAEDGLVALSIDTSVVDASETLAVAIADVPSGAVLSAGTDAGDGRWTVALADLADLTLTPPADYSGQFALDVVATSRDGADAAETRARLGVTVTPVADVPQLAVREASGVEDGAIGLSIEADIVDASESLTVEIGDVPSGAVLSAGTDAGDGRWTVAATALAGLTLTPPADYSGRFTLDVAAVSVDGEDRATAAETLAVTVAAIADRPSLTVQDVSGAEDGAIELVVTAAPGDVSEVLTIGIGGLPEGASLSAGTAGEDGRWELSPADLAGLTLTPPSNFSGDIPLTVAVTATDGPDEQVVRRGLRVAVAPRADLPSLEVSDALGIEDGTITLDLTATTNDPSETMTVAVQGLPLSARLSAGEQDGSGRWIVNPDDLWGLTLVPPEHFNGRLELTVTAIASDGDDIAERSSPVVVTVAPVADLPLVTAKGVFGITGEPISLEGLIQPSGRSERLRIVLDGVPTTASLTKGSDEGEGRWTLTSEDLDGLALQLPSDFAGDFVMAVEMIALDGNDRKDGIETLQVVVRSEDSDAPVAVAGPPDGTLTAPEASNAALARFETVGLPQPEEQTSRSVAPEPSAADLPGLPDPAPAEPESVAALPPTEPPQPVLPKMSPAELASLTSRGEELLRIGDISAARLLFELAAANDFAAAATGLGKTYDPLYFEEAGVLGGTADPDKAMRWYGVAAGQGDAEADSRRTRLEEWLAGTGTSPVGGGTAPGVSAGAAPVRPASETAQRAF